jgi:hypothetical protein
LRPLDILTVEITIEVTGVVGVSLDLLILSFRKVFHQNEAKWQLKIAVYVIKSLIIRLKGNDIAY